MYEVGAILNYAAANYIALTKNVGMTSGSSSSDWAILDSGPKRSASDTPLSTELRGPVGAAIASCGALSIQLRARFTVSVE
jgi:hypothetical protein